MLVGFANLFFQSGTVQTVLSILSVLIFAGLTAWDTQALKDQYYENAGSGYEIAQKLSIYGALKLYLDFVNMFQSLLYLFGERND